MSQTVVSSHPQASSFSLDDLERTVARSKGFAWFLIVGVPALGMVASVLAQLPLFAAMMAGSFLFATSLVCRKAIATFTGKTLRLLVAGRMVLVLVLAALLLGTTGNVWAGVVSALLLWLVADRLLGRRALYDLWKLVRDGR